VEAFAEDAERTSKAPVLKSCFVTDPPPVGGGKKCIFVVVWYVLAEDEDEDTTLAVHVTVVAFMLAFSFPRLNASSVPVELMGTVPCARRILLALIETLNLDVKYDVGDVTWAISEKGWVPGMARSVRAASTMKVAWVSSP